MKYSCNWLQEHLDKPLPKTDELVSVITTKAFEVEGTQEIVGDAVLEMKVLPDRAHDALAHRGMAREIAGLFGLPRKERVTPDVKADASVPVVRVTIADAKLCTRYIGTRVDGVKVVASPDALATKITSIGGRSISNIVDLTNFVLFDIGQPMHAFDADKIVGGITVRLAKAGEGMVTLDGKELSLDGTELVIADDEGVLALAGIKGGKKAEVDGNTTSIIFESANFDPTLTRRTSTKHNIKTDASKRYENGITSNFAKEGVRLVLSELIKMQPGVRVGEMADVYPTAEKGGYTLPVSAQVINKLLGSSMTANDVESVLVRLQFSYKKDGDEFVVTIPDERLDLRITEDLVEEIGRHHGYDKIEGVVPKLSRKGVPNKRLYYANKVRKFLVARGYSEVFTYSFAVKGEGEVEVLNPVGNDRPFMRMALRHGIERALQSNFYNAPLLEVESIKIFEVGNVFSQNKECMLLTIGYMPEKSKSKKATEEMRELTDTLDDHLGHHGLWQRGGEGKMFFADMDFDDLIKNLPEPTSYELLEDASPSVVYETLSTYPFIVRDIAIFVPQEVTEDYIEKLLKKEAGDLVVRFSQFDKFQKPGEDRISYAYRMVFQSFERTLTDDEVGTIMERITLACNAEKDWQVR